MNDFEKLQQLLKIVPLEVEGYATLNNGTRVVRIRESDLVMILEHLVGVDKQLDEIDAKLEPIRKGLGFT